MASLSKIVILVNCGSTVNSNYRKSFSNQTQDETRVKHHHPFGSQQAWKVSLFVRGKTLNLSASKFAHLWARNLVWTQCSNFFSQFLIRLHPYVCYAMHAFELRERKKTFLRLHFEFKPLVCLRNSPHNEKNLINIAK